MLRIDNLIDDTKWQRTINPIITETIAPGAMGMTDEYDIYARLPEWGDGHKTVCHSKREFARTKTVTAFAKSTSTRSKASGRYCVRGCVLTVASRKSCFRSISVSLNSCTMSANAGKHSSDRFSRCC